MPKQPKASPAKVAYHLKQLRKLFGRTNDTQFLQMVWAIDALRWGHRDAAARLLAFPPQAADQCIGSPFAIHQWELETLLVQLLLKPRDDTQTDAAAVFDCSNFGSIAELVNRLRKLEDVESAAYLGGGDINIVAELHRIAQRQFHWQRGYLNLPQFYRYTFIYAQGKCGEYFENTYGLPITELNFVGFALFAHFMSVPWISRTFTVPELGLSSDLMKRALPLLLIAANRAREETKKFTDQVNSKHGRAIPTAFLPNIIRLYPLVCLTDEANEFMRAFFHLLFSISRAPWRSSISSSDRQFMARARTSSVPFDMTTLKGSPSLIAPRGRSSAASGVLFCATEICTQSLHPFGLTHSREGRPGVVGGYMHRPRNPLGDHFSAALKVARPPLQAARE
jgi:hypothetical protein